MQDHLATLQRLALMASDMPPGEEAFGQATTSASASRQRLGMSRDKFGTTWLVNIAGAPQG